jgi:hypothetical protein
VWANDGRSPVPTIIKFAGAEGEHALGILVDEDVEAVQGALTANGGLPVALTLAVGDKSRVYVNPRTVAFWHAKDVRSGRAMF